MNELELRQMFKNLSDCYADTHVFSEEGFIEGEVIQAMTEDRFIEALQQAKLLVKPAVSVAKHSLPRPLEAWKQARELPLSEYIDWHLAQERRGNER